MEKPKLYLTTQDPYAVHGPDDKIKGTANIELVNTLRAKYVIVSLLGGYRTNALDGTSPKRDFFHKQFKVPYHNKRGDASKELGPGQHKWDFEFTLPAANELPPSFYYRDEEGCIEILYCLVMCVYKNTTSGLSKDNIATTTLKYSPKRSSRIISTALRSSQTVEKSFLVRRSRSKHEAPNDPRLIPKLIWRAKSQLMRVREKEFLHVALTLPKHAAFCSHLDITLQIRTQDEGMMAAAEVKLTKVEYRLIASTRVTIDHNSRFHRHQIQHSAYACNVALKYSDDGTSLRRHTPFRIQPRIHGVPLDKKTFSTLGPSFATDHIVREYSLDVDLFFLVDGKDYRVRCENNDLIILPQDVQPNGEG